MPSGVLRATRATAAARRLGRRLATTARRTCVHVVTPGPSAMPRGAGIASAGRAGAASVPRGGGGGGGGPSSAAAAAITATPPSAPPTSPIAIAARRPAPVNRAPGGAGHAARARAARRRIVCSRPIASIYPEKRGLRRLDVSGCATTKPVELTILLICLRVSGRSKACTAGVLPFR